MIPGGWPRTPRYQGRHSRIRRGRGSGLQICGLGVNGGPFWRSLLAETTFLGPTCAKIQLHQSKVSKFFRGRTPGPRYQARGPREMVAEAEERRDGEDAKEGGMGGDGRRPISTGTHINGVIGVPFILCHRSLLH